MILGIDEVGRGAWAGPLVVGAVVLGDTQIKGLTDSKLLTKRKRAELDVLIRISAAGYGTGWVEAAEIDNIGLSKALNLATKRAVEKISVPYHEIIIDGTVNFLDGTTKGKYVTTMAKADLLLPCVSAASIIAKVARDNYMSEQDNVYTDFSFTSHVGYGTVKHRNAINKNGITPLHRLSFSPLRKYICQNSGKEEVSHKLKKENSNISNTIGRIAEDAVAEYLIKNSHSIIHKNWKNKYCEIDIISKKSNTFYLTEVKYRRQDNQGGGLAAITNKKFNKMKFAAKVYIQASGLQNNNVILAVASVKGDPPVVADWFVLD